MELLKEMKSLLKLTKPWNKKQHTTADKRNRWFSVICDFIFLFSFFLK